MELSKPVNYALWWLDTNVAALLSQANRRTRQVSENGVGGGNGRPPVGSCRYGGGLSAIILVCDNPY